MASKVSASDVKELIMQLFYLPEIFLNREQFSLGHRQKRAEAVQIDAVEECCGESLSPSMWVAYIGGYSR